MSAKGDHSPELDGVRGLAILLVLLLHHLANVRLGPLGMPFRAGWIGVDLFFVLSGFLITRILLRQRGRPGYFRSFYARRALRIWPLYTLVLVFALVAAWRIPPPALSYEVPASQAVAYALYVQNIAFPGVSGPWPLKLTWSLAIEEQFYVVWPLLVALLPERALRRFLWAVVAGMPMVRWAALAAGATPLSVYMHTGCRLDGLAVGGLLALAVMRPGSEGVLRRARWGAALLPVAGAVILSPLMGGNQLYELTEPISGASLWALGGCFTLLALGFGGLLAMVLGGGVRAARAAFSPGALRWLGTRSYGLYLYHSTTLHLDQLLLRPWLRERLGDHRMAVNVVGLALALGGLFALAELSFRFFERPLLSLRSRFEPNRPAAESLGAEASPGL